MPDLSHSRLGIPVIAVDWLFIVAGEVRWFVGLRTP